MTSCRLWSKRELVRISRSTGWFAPYKPEAQASELDAVPFTRLRFALVLATAPPTLLRSIANYIHKKSPHRK